MLLCNNALRLGCSHSSVDSLLLSSSHPRVESQAHHKCFYQLQSTLRYICHVKRKTINKKRPGSAHLSKQCSVICFEDFSQFQLNGISLCSRSWTIFSWKRFKSLCTQVRLAFVMNPGSTLHACSGSIRTHNHSISQSAMSTT